MFSCNTPRPQEKTASEVLAGLLCTHGSSLTLEHHHQRVGAISNLISLSSLLLPRGTMQPQHLQHRPLPQQGPHLVG